MKIDPIGGQALIEGVMMRSAKKVGVAYLVKGKIQTESFASLPWTKKYAWLNIPFIRGVFVLIEILILGTRMLLRSAQLQEEDEEPISAWDIIGTILFSIVFGLLIFKLMPLLLTRYFLPQVQGILFNVIDGLTRIILFIIYLLTLNMMQDVKRLFQFHGAEHKAVNCYEQGKELTVKNALACSRFHERCGTAFILYNLVISILIFSFVPTTLPLWELFMLRLPLLIPIAGISYEIIKATSKGFYFLKVPGLWLQRLTTREPDAEHMKVAIAALKAAQ